MWLVRVRKRECGYRGTEWEDPSPGGSVYFPAEVGGRGVSGG